jgi:pyridoxine 4-dehydrogenase
VVDVKIGVSGASGHLGRAVVSELLQRPGALGGSSRLHSATLSAIASRIGATPLQVAQAWLLQRSPNILLIPGTSSVAHLRENLAAGTLTLSEEDVAALNGIASA